MHICPVESPAPHVGGPITGATCSTVLIEGLPAATVSSICTCQGPPDEIISGSINVVIRGSFAARKNDKTAHGGTVSTGCASVLIGGQAGSMLWEDEKKEIIEHTLHRCITLLQQKYDLLANGDHATLQLCKKYFGRNDKEAVEIIAKRIQKIKDRAGAITDKNFTTVLSEDKERRIWADVFPEDPSHMVRLNNLFWTAMHENDKAGLVIHELSHFAGKDELNTKDVIYSKSILRLAKCDSENALYNADNFEYFIIQEI